MVNINRKRQIIEKATELFSKEGFDKITIRILAHACGISEPGLYRHFKSKDDIYCAVLDSLEEKLRYRELFDRLETEDDVEVILRDLALHILKFFIANVAHYRLLLYSTLRGHPQARKVFRVVRGTYVRFLMEQFDRLYAKGLILEKNNEITARCFVGMVFDCALGTTLWKGFVGKAFKPELVVSNNIPIYARGLRVDPTARG